jgi:tripartite-type tricarboxylate transporter receptor subunit TctC
MRAMLSRKGAVSFFMCLMVIGIGGAFAQEKYPTRNIEFIVPMAPGGTTATLAAIFADEMGKELKVPIAVINKPGASGTVGASFVLQGKKDGYTLLTGSGSGLTLAPQMLPDVPFQTLRDFSPICIIGTSPNIIYVKNDSPFKSFEDVMDEAKKNPLKLSYGTAGTGSDCHFFMEQMQMYGGIKVSHIPYKGGGEVLPAVLGGHIDFGVSLMATVASQIRGGAARGLIISDEKRNPVFKDIPTTFEKGYRQQFINHWTAFFAPAGVPQAVLDVLIPAASKTIKSENFSKRVEALGCGVSTLTPAQFRSYIAEEEKIAAGIAKEINKKGK